MNAACTHIDRARQPVILLNPSAGGGTSLRTWRRIRGFVRERLGGMTVITLRSTDSVPDIVLDLYASGHRRFVAGGGDGTVNALVASLAAVEPAAQRPQLGAIALGSSNDFHKPVRPDQQVNGISCKMEFERAQARDVGVLDFEVTSGAWERRYWIVNASLGITADANDFFNSPDTFLRVLKRRSTATGILYAALSSIIRYRNQPRWIQVASSPARRALVTNLGVVKSPHFSGRFSYDSLYDPRSGRFHVHLCESMSLRETLQVLWHLSRGRFGDVGGTMTWTTDRLLVTGAVPFPVEFDGEVIRTRKAAFSIARNRLEVCV